MKQQFILKEAIHRLVEIYYYLGLIEESQKYASLLGYNYASSQWYDATYKIFNKNYEKKEIIKATKKKKGIVLENLKNFFSKMKKEQVKKNYLEKVKLLQKHNKSYYDKSAPHYKGSNI